jgi:hypothetical protein
MDCPTDCAPAGVRFALQEIQGRVCISSTNNYNYIPIKPHNHYLEETLELAMAELKSPIDILKLLDKSNCRECGEPTCLAFAAAVFNNRKHLHECPHLEEEVLNRFSNNIKTRAPADRDMEKALQSFQENARGMDPAEAARRLGGRYDRKRLSIKILGKDVTVDAEGHIHTNIHMNPWVMGPAMHYILHSSGHPISREWVRFRDLKNGPERYPLFMQRCERVFKKVADAYPNLFKDMLDAFAGDRDYNQFGSDVSIILHPLPKVPILICYWKPDEGMESDLSIFFDSTADDNLGAEMLFTLGVGLAEMFKKFAARHGFDL